MTSLCSDASSSVSSRRRQPQDDSVWERMNEEIQKRKEKGSVFSASPWEREEKEKLQHEQVLDARRARDQEIFNLESISERSEKQEEWLRILRLEREFQRRAEQELNEDEEGSVCSDSSDSDSEKMENFHGDKLTVIPNERLGLKLLDELLENPSKNSSPSEKVNPERELIKSPSDKHFIPLDVTIREENHNQPNFLPLPNNAFEASAEQTPDMIGSRLSKAPVPAPRPSKAFIPISPTNTLKPQVRSNDPSCSSDFVSETAYSNGCEFNAKKSNLSSLTKLEISETSAFFCTSGHGDDYSRELPQDNWLIEVNSFESGNFADRDGGRTAQPLKHSGNSKDESRIYENIKPADYLTLKSQQSVANDEFNSHTLPKSTSNSLISNESFNSRSSNGPTEKKFPSMGVSSTLKKTNGFIPCDADILTSLYASCKTRTGYTKDVPGDLSGKSPEFKKLWISRPEKLTFQDKIRKFSLQAGEDDIPRDRVKNSRAQREIENKFSETQKRTASTSDT